jgi:hypothetical protein
MPARNYSQWILKADAHQIRISHETAHDLGSALPVVFASAQDVTTDPTLSVTDFDCTSGWLKAHRAFASDRVTNWTVTERFHSNADRIHVSERTAKAAADAFASKVAERVLRGVQASARARAALEATGGI